MSTVKHNWTEFSADKPGVMLDVMTVEKALPFMQEIAEGSSEKWGYSF